MNRYQVLLSIIHCLLGINECLLWLVEHIGDAIDRCQNKADALEGFVLP